MYFPWSGLLDQIRLADVFVHYDDVQFARGFLNRVQVKTANGPCFMTVPLRKHPRAVLIEEVEPCAPHEWVPAHRALLLDALRGAPHLDDAIALFDAVTREQAPSLGALARRSMLAVSDYFGLSAGTRFLRSDTLGVEGRSSERLLGLCRSLGADTYLTGHGARNYLDHALFEAHGVAVRYMDYRAVPYPQRHGAFTPYVTSLDLVANCGPGGVRNLCSGTLGWKEFLGGSA
jgi:hypothetical protein